MIEIDKVIIGYDNIHDTMFDMIRISEKYCFISSFELDIEFMYKKNMSLKKEIQQALERGVIFYIIVSALCLNSISQKPLQELKQKFPSLLHIKIHHSRDQDKKFFHNTFQYWINTLQQLPYLNTLLLPFHNKSFAGIHSRFVYNEKQLLVCGGNYSKKYSGCINRINNTYNYAWFDSSLLLNCSSSILTTDILNIYNDNYNTISYPLICSGVKHYNYIIYEILNSKHEIFFVNQYFFSNNKLTQNKISEVLIERIVRAIQNEEMFHTTLIINKENIDDEISVFRNYKLYSISIITHYSIQHLIQTICKKTHISISKLNNYLSIFSPINNGKNIIVHNKVFMFDEKKCLFTSANIYDASFYSKGQQEFGYITTNESQCKKIKSSVPYELFKKLDLDFESHYQYIPFYFINNTIFFNTIGKLILIFTFVFAPLHHDISSNLFFTWFLYMFIRPKEYTCDNIDLLDMKQNPFPNLIDNKYIET